MINCIKSNNATAAGSLDLMNWTWYFQKSALKGDSKNVRKWIRYMLTVRFAAKEAFMAQKAIGLGDP